MDGYADQYVFIHRNWSLSFKVQFCLSLPILIALYTVKKKSLNRVLLEIVREV